MVIHARMARVGEALPGMMENETVAWRNYTEQGHLNFPGVKTIIRSHLFHSPRDH